MEERESLPRKGDRDWSGDQDASFRDAVEGRSVSEPAIGNEGITSRGRNEDSGRVSSHLANLTPVRARFDHGPRGLSGDGLRAASYG